uniref:Polyisoprenoid diphosphate/phosphate phosphohydrolase PLPP6 n=1 Tax=Cynoglossus semilaevis TaxID=244447 RepID=A0A3P8VE62_CYNSE
RLRGLFLGQLSAIDEVDRDIRPRYSLADRRCLLSVQEQRRWSRSHAQPVHGIVKTAVRRRRPAHNRMDMFATFSVDRYSFPSGHSTRAALCGRFLLAHLVLAAPLRVLVLLWAGLVGFSRVLLGRHNVSDVLFGFFMGYWQYNLVETLWLSPLTLQRMLG